MPLKLSLEMLQLQSVNSIKAQAVRYSPLD